ncbi:MAG: protein tyrosine phosphatase family protein [Pseudomonadales bacterium]
MPNSSKSQGLLVTVLGFFLLCLILAQTNAESAQNLVEASGIFAARSVNQNLAFSGQLVEADVETLMSMGFTVVINLSTLNRERNGDEDEWVTSKRLSYHHLPVDFSAPTESDLARFFSLLDSLRGQKVWVHCFVNYRASAFIYLYRIHRLGDKNDEAEASLNEFWTPELRATYPQWEDFLEFYGPTGPEPAF